jgi:hypothetical protein
MTERCTICSNETARPCKDRNHPRPINEFESASALDCLLRQRDALRATVEHWKSCTSSTATQSEPPTDRLTALLASTLLNYAANVAMNVTSLKGPNSDSLVSWLRDLPHTDYNLSVAVAWDIQTAILNATTAAYAQHYPSEAMAYGLTSPSERVSPNPMSADTALAQGVDPGAELASQVPLHSGDLHDAISNAHQDAWDVVGFSVHAFLTSLSKLGYHVVEKASVAGGAPIPPLEWKQFSDRSVLSIRRLHSGNITGEYAIFQSGRGWRIDHNGYYIGWHLTLDAAKADCEIHYAASQSSLRSDKEGTL